MIARRLFPLPLLLASALFAQDPAAQSGPQTPIPTIRANARIVVVDVTVTDKSGQPVKGLKQSDFTLLENKSPQNIAHFEEHTALPPAPFTPPPPMPPGVFTNFTPPPLSSAANVLLLDTLNTPMQDQSFVRGQMLKYLKSARPGTRLAIFGLTDHLILLQGFTSDPDLLRNAIERVNPKLSPLLEDAGGTHGQQSIADQYGGAVSGLATPSFLTNLYDFEAEQKSFDIQNRISYTLDAMNLLARYLADIPGRKNLLWFSGAFPIDIIADADAGGSPFAGLSSSQNEFRDTTNLFTRAQVAVYPIDAIGIRTDATNRASAGDSSKDGGDRKNGVLDSRTFTQSVFDDHATMDQMARDTGGKAFYNTNGLADAVTTAIDAGSNYYTLSYTPATNANPGVYRNIHVDIAKSSYKLSYRAGYYEEPPNSARAATAPPPPRALRTASLYGAPPVTQIVFKAIVNPATSKPESEPVKGNATPPKSTGPWVRYVVGYTILARQLEFSTSSDAQRHAAVKILTLVYDTKGVMVNSVLNTVHADLTPAQYASLLHTGLPYRQEISVPEKGVYSIRLLVLDETSNHIGATELPVAAVKNLPPLSASAEAAPAKPTR